MTETPSYREDLPPGPRASPLGEQFPPHPPSDSSMPGQVRGAEDIPVKCIKVGGPEAPLRSPPSESIGTSAVFSVLSRVVEVWRRGRDTETARQRDRGP